ncbi:carboxylesterase/lipase family protein [Streptomyces sp. NBC_01477]|uniref:carboxylesterase/lipase family protein n=1 Tax=Streptomyces sp. NBC_01477 TaxID=2976015 RepID=UPI002E3400C9|nr:carboxylesterase family protein [Streptomyces sp. NBC_01477]
MTSPCSTPGPEILTSEGRVRGAEGRDSVYRYLGIPYAAAPLGRYRFAPPRPAEPWTGVRDARHYGPTAPKGAYPAVFAPLFAEVDVPGDEFLNVNVWTPVAPGEDAGLPVLVWIHGGSYVNGSGANPEYRGDAFARDGVVAVTLNYRLGAEGFLHLDDAEPSAPGLLDQLAALRWVRRNIAAFGGDPSRVTVAGQSAGGGSVLHLLAMEPSAGLFRAAVAQSSLGQIPLPPAAGREVTADLARRVGSAPSRAALFEVPLPELTAAASSLTAEVQMGTHPKRWSAAVNLSLLPFQPVLDGRTVSRAPYDAYAGGAGAGIPLLIGTTAEEGRLFLVPTGAIDAVDEAALSAAAGSFGLEAEGAVAVYRRRLSGGSPGDVLAALFTDWFFRIPAIRAAELRGAAGATTYAYEFAVRSDSYDGRLGACHGMELPYVFDTLDEPGAALRVGSSPSRAAAKAVHAGWVRFISETQPGWAPYEPPNRTTMCFDAFGEPVDDPRRAERELWSGHR